MCRYKSDCRSEKRFKYEKILVLVLIATMMLMTLSAAEDVTQSATIATSTTHGFEATFALAGILAVTLAALRRRL